MKTIKLSPNWTVQGSKLVLASLVAFSVNIIGTSLLMFIMPVLLFITVLNFLQIRFLHCYKAGICYSRGFGKRYINAEEIKAIEFKKVAFLTVFKISLENGEKYHFSNWQINEEQQLAITKLYKVNKGSSTFKAHVECKA